MSEKDKKESRQKLTNDTRNDHNHTTKVESIALTSIDPRIIELVRFLARTAAEKDYAEFLAKTQRETENTNKKETLQ